MDYGKNDLWSVWIDLERIEEELKWGGCPPGFGPQYDCMGRPASASLNVAWAYEQMGRVKPGSYCIPQETILIREKMDFGMQIFFGSLSRDENDFVDMFAPALKKLGRLKHDEMYGFVPALALGGPSALDHLQKVKAVEHLLFLAQLAPLHVLTPADF